MDFKNTNKKAQFIPPLKGWVFLCPKDKGEIMPRMSEQNLALMNNNLQLMQDSGVWEALQQLKDRTAKLTDNDSRENSQNAESDSKDMDTAQKQAAGYRNAAQFMGSGGAGETNPANAAITGGINGAAAGASIGMIGGAQGAGYGAIIGAGVGALNGIMQAQANARREREGNMRARAYALADQIQAHGIQQQNTLTNLMSSYNNVLLSRRAKY